MPHRIVIIEPSVVFRRVLNTVLGEDPQVTIAAQVESTDAALQKLASEPADLVITELALEGDPFAGIRALRAQYPTLPLLVFSLSTQAGEPAAAEALLAGASACAGKPTQAGSLAASMGKVRADLVPKVHELLGEKPAMQAVTGPLRVLVVDDSRPMRMMIGKLLKEIGAAQIVEAEHGLQGLERLQEHGAFSVALVDWNMPEMNGLEMVAEVRKDAKFAAMPILMVTTETEFEKVREAFDAGANAFLTKPFTKPLMLEKLASVGVQLP